MYRPAGHEVSSSRRIRPTPSAANLLRRCASVDLGGDQKQTMQQPTRFPAETCGLEGANLRARCFSGLDPICECFPAGRLRHRSSFQTRLHWVKERLRPGRRELNSAPGTCCGMEVGGFIVVVFGIYRIDLISFLPSFLPAREPSRCSASHFATSLVRAYRPRRFSISNTSTGTVPRSSALRSACKLR